MKRHRDNIVMGKLDTPKKVTFSSGRTFYAKYKIVIIDSLPDNVIIKRRHRRRGRRNKLKKWCGLKGILKKGFDLVKRVAKSKVRRSLTKIATENLSKKCVDKIKNKNLQKILRRRKYAVRLWLSLLQLLL